MLKITGVKHWLWRAVDQAGVVLDVLVQRRRNKQAAKRLLRKLLKRQMRAPRVMITDKLASYGAASCWGLRGGQLHRHTGLGTRADCWPSASEKGWRQPASAAVTLRAL